MFKKILPIALIAVLIVNMFAGCTGGSSTGADLPSENAGAASDSSQAAMSEPDTSTEAPTVSASIAYPVEGSPKLTYYVSLNPNIAATVTSLGDTPYAKQLEKETGISVEYIHAPQGQSAEFFNIMIASGDLPDIIEYSWKLYPGGIQKAIDDGAIVPLNDIFAEYSPDIMQYIKENPELEKDIKTDSGEYFMYPQFTNDLRLSAVHGIVARGDWMDELKITSPETVEELREMLIRFRDEKGAIAPFTFNFTTEPFKTGALAGGFDVKNDYYIEDGKIVYGALQPGFKDFLIEMNLWYNEGLLDKNFAVVDGKTIDSKMLTGESGATFGYAGAHMGNYMTAATEDGYKIYGIQAMATEKGRTPEFGNGGDLVMNSGAAITSKCMDIESAAKLLNYGYSEAGHMLMNFGIENESYTMVDGKPTYTDLIMNNPDGLTKPQAMGLYIRASYSGPMDKDYGYQEQYLAMPEQIDAIARWTNSNKLDHLIPWISFTSEESEDVARISNAAKTLVDEYMVKFIAGTESFDNYEAFIEQLNKIGVPKALEHYDAALTRYKQR